ncbi:GreA/GreB family elongation factor [Mycobacterium gordonae]|jgi:transcription elongation GreA/GreB family factor|nr:GreA/GreB family elongation factor [Mycobacterium gordonae]
MDCDPGPVAASGMVVTIRHDATGNTETFLLGRRFGEGADLPVYSTLSPIGRAVLGARPGERRTAMIPHDTRPISMTLLSAVPYPGPTVAGRQAAL